jgi:hypothetical protein
LCNNGSRSTINQHNNISYTKGIREGGVGGWWDGEPSSPSPFSNQALWTSQVLGRLGTFGSSKNSKEVWNKRFMKVQSGLPFLFFIFCNLLNLKVKFNINLNMLHVLCGKKV